MSDFMTGLKISSSGLSAQRLRMNLISSNLANAQSTRTNGPGSGPYKRQDVVFEAKDADSEFSDLVAQATGTDLKEVAVTEIHQDQSPPKRVYEPNHVDADSEGYVSYPNINVMEEMVNLIMATRAYEANVTAVNASKGMAMKALEIGR